ncbi:hypothetical protein, partial [Brachyspira catarrhinii]|uniref:hypothetical protein n=1 Tax=Brachyspira catarrhinii TaxID=2528966 RepID=UPI001F19AA3B
YLIITLIHIYCKSFVNFIVSQVSLFAFMILFVVITRAAPEVIYSVWIASLTLAMTITKIFNSISFRDYSLLFIKN